MNDIASALNDKFNAVFTLKEQSVEGAEFGDKKRKVQAKFTLNNYQYKLVVTDPRIESDFLKNKDCQYQLNTGEVYMCMNNELFTVGHSTHTVEYFLGLLKQHSINVVCDVRSQPYSKYNPQFNGSSQEFETGLRSW